MEGVSQEENLIYISLKNCLDSVSILLSVVSQVPDIKSSLYYF